METMFGNFIIAIALLFMMYLFMQEFLNAIHSGLFNKLKWLIKKTVILSLKLVLLPFVIVGKGWRNFRHPPFNEIHRYGPRHLKVGHGRGQRGG